MDNSIVHMEPTKEFFIDILVKDIRLISAIMELIDNSIDSARRNGKKLNNYEIRLTLSGRNFTIRDNCGGISIERASNYAFKFGNANKDKLNQFIIGHYGIGMKRAFFKLGNKISIESFTDKEFFTLFLDVNMWRKAREWNIKFNNYGVNNNSKLIGTTIKIEGLNEESKKCFSNEYFIKELRNEISKRHRSAIKSGISIIANGYKVLISTKVTEREITRYLINKETYTAEIIINKDLSSYQESGWNIYLNNRLVVSSDKTELTGWNIEDEENGNKIKANLYVIAKNNSILPFNTTKEGLDTSNPIYRELKDYMIKALAESIPKVFDKNLVSIKYERSRNEVEKLKKHLKVKYAKSVGEITYEDYIKRNKIKL